LILLAEVLLFFRHVLFLGGYVIPWDLRYDHFPIASFVAESFARGELPLWDPFTYNGRPLYANIQAQVFYPPAAAVSLLSNAIGGDHLLYLLEWQIALHVWLGGVFTFLLLRRLGAGSPAALAGATMYQLGGFFASQVQHLGAVCAGAWLPFAWLCVAGLSQRITARRVAALAAGFAMAILAGLPAMAVVVLVSAGLLALLLFLFRLAPLRLPAVVAVAGLLALPLTAVQLAPTVELTWQSVAQYRDAWLGSGGGLPLESLVSLVIPNYHGIFDLSTYSLPYDATFLYLYGSLGGLLLAVGAAVRPARRETAMFAVFTVVCGLWMLGDSTPPGAALFELLPAFIRIGLHPEFALAAFSLSFAVLAGLGAGRFVRRSDLGYLLAGVIAVDLLLVSSGRTMNAFPIASEPGVHRDHFDGSRELMERMRTLTRTQIPPWRIDTAGDSLSWAMCAPITQVPTANGNDPFAPARVIRARLAFAPGEHWGRYYEVQEISSPVLDLMNVRYLLSHHPISEERVEAARFRHVASLPGHEIYENSEALPRFFTVPRIRRARTMEGAAEYLQAADFDPRREAIVEGPAGLPDLFPGAAEAVIRVQAYEPRRVRLEVDTPAATFLVASDTHYPGWKSFIDGQETPLLRTNVAFRGLVVPPGRHEVLMEFRPSILPRALVASALSWLFWAACLGGRRGRVASPGQRAATEASRD
jgi:hypothetical protein